MLYTFFLFVLAVVRGQNDPGGNVSSPISAPSLDWSTFSSSTLAHAPQPPPQTLPPAPLPDGQSFNFSTIPQIPPNSDAFNRALNSTSRIYTDFMSRRQALVFNLSQEEYLRRIGLSLSGGVLTEGPGGACESATLAANFAVAEEDRVLGEQRSCNASCARAQVRTTMGFTFLVGLVSFGEWTLP